MTINKPEVYHIKHPLGDKNLSDQVLSSYSDEAIAEYRSEWDEYRTVQGQAVAEVNELYQTARSYFNVLFGRDTKQTKYLERQINNGELFTDKHAKRYPHPKDVEEKVQEARSKYCSFLSQDNAPKTGGDDTLQEINNAVTYLMDKELVLNTDFTVSNAVSLAQSIASESFDDAVGEEDYAVPASQFNLTVKGMDSFPTDNYSIYEERGYIRLRCDEINYEPTDDVEIATVGQYLTYTVLFNKSSEPTYSLCAEQE